MKAESWGLHPVCVWLLSLGQCLERSRVWGLCVNRPQCACPSPVGDRFVVRNGAAGPLGVSLCVQVHSVSGFSGVAWPGHAVSTYLTSERPAKIPFKGSRHCTLPLTRGGRSGPGASALCLVCTEDLGGGGGGWGDLRVAQLAFP